MTATLFLCGAGNPDGVRLALRINAEPRWDRVVVLDDDPATHGRTTLGVPVAGPLDLLRDADSRRDETASLITRTTRRRWAARERISSFGLPAATLISPSVDTLGAETADDVIVYPGAELGVEARIGRSSAILVGARVGHESAVGECCVVGPGAVLNARVTLEQGVYVGSNAVILPEVTVGAWASIGACAVVTSDVPGGATVAATPPDVLGVSGPSEPSSQAAGVLSALAPPVHTGDTALVVRQSWTEALGRSEIGMTVNFFEAGGDSLAATRVVSRLRELTGSRLTLVDFYRFPTISDLAHHLDSQRAASTIAQRRAEVRHRLAAARAE